MKLKDVALFLNGEISGDQDIEILGVAGISEAKGGDITFLSDARLAKECSGSEASAVVVRKVIPDLGKPQVVVRNPQYAFAKLLEHFYVRPPGFEGISELAFVSKTALVAKEVSIYPLAYVSDDAVIKEGTVIFPGVFIGSGAVIGERCVVYPNVTVREKVVIGSGVIIHPGAVIGSDGFGYVFEEGRHYKIPQVGGVIIGDDVEIGSNVSIDRATTGYTVIGKGTKIDNLVQIAHNVQVGENSVIAAQTGIAGSSRVGSLVALAGQVGVADHVKIGDGCRIGAQSGVMADISDGVYSGYPAMHHRDWLRSAALYAKLPELSKRIKQLEEKIEILERGRK
jgi:UDP-3-O-[3-hydroxymyristoyl] glucosamine N-acyltransferase